MKLKSDKNYQAIVIEFHEKYSEIANAQRNLPRRRGNKNYTEDEFKIIEMASNLRQEMIDVQNEIKKGLTNRKYLEELQNMIYGTQEVKLDPYWRIS